MRTKNLLFILCGLIASFSVIGCDDDPVDSTTDRQTVTVTEKLTGNSGEKTDVTIAPASNNTITLEGYYFVEAGSTLTIPAGTIVKASSAVPSAIIVQRGTATEPSGQIFAEGNANNPIIFTSDRAAGSRGRGNWGGIVLQGLSDLNLDSKSGVAEGVGGSYGYGGVLSEAKLNDNSGILKYVRIEYGGTKVTTDNEINGLTMNAVGNGTTIEYVQSHMIADDGFEWFGGTVNAKYLVSSGNDDDAFDMDFGYSGNLQFLFALQDPDLANRGFEIDNDGDGSTKMPFTSATVANVTIVGTGKDKANSEDNDGFYLRRSNKLNIWNAISTNFRYAMVVDGATTGQHAQNGELFVKQSILNGRTAPYLAKGSAADYTNVAEGWGNVIEDPQLTGINFSNPQPRPQNAKAANVGAVPNNGYFTSNTYAGAFDPNSSSYWFSGWTNWAKN